MSILIIPDIHEETEQLQKILTKYNYISKKISLGDWYDNHVKGEYNVDSVVETSKMHSDFVENPDHICLFGNHDMPYAFPGIYELSCSGHRGWKRMYIKVNWKKIKLFQWETLNKKEWLLSHAGFHPCFAPITKGNLTNLCNAALENLYGAKVDDILQAGEYRGGLHRWGGCTWHDFREFVPTPGVNQIVGHTHNPGIWQKHIDDSQNFCIDFKNENGQYLVHIAILEDDGTVHIECV
jgi:predicted phosphodiesterase